MIASAKNQIEYMSWSQNSIYGFLDSVSASIMLKLTENTPPGKFYLYPDFEGNPSTGRVLPVSSNFAMGLI